MVFLHLDQGCVLLPVQRAMVSARASSTAACHGIIPPRPIRDGRRPAQVGLAEDDDAPFEAALGGEEARAASGLLHQRLVDAHDEVGHAGKVAEAFPRRLFQRRQRIVGKGLARELAGEGEGEGRRVALGRLKPLAVAGDQLAGEVAEAVQRRRQSRRDRVLGQHRRVGEAAGIAGLLGADDGRRPLAAGGVAQVAVEGELARAGHRPARHAAAPSIDKLVLRPVLGNQDFALFGQALGQHHDLQLGIVDFLQPHRAHARHVVLQQLGGAGRHVA
jgi:hypothetical protein